MKDVNLDDADYWEDPKEFKHLLDETMLRGCFCTQVIKQTRGSKWPWTMAKGSACLSVTQEFPELIRAWIEHLDVDVGRGHGPDSESINSSDHEGGAIKGSRTRLAEATSC